MKIFLQFLAVACICLLSWQQATLHSEWLPVSLFLVFAGIMAAYMTVRSKPTGYWLAVLLGIGYTAEVFVRVQDLGAASPLVAWATCLTASAASLLWSSRPRSNHESDYERHAQY